MNEITALDIAQVEETRRGFEEMLATCDETIATAQANVTTAQRVLAESKAHKQACIDGIANCDALLANERLRRFH